jgi:hypothetical protein
MRGLPAAADIAAVGERLERARSQVPGVVRAVPQPLAVVRDGRYVVEARVVAWADHGDAALHDARRLLEAAKVECDEIYLSGRALSEADAPRPEAAAARGSGGRRPQAPTRRKAAAKPRAGRARAAKGRRR